MGSSDMLRFAIIGCAAGIAPTHIKALQQLASAQIVAMSDINPVLGTARATETGCSFYLDHRTMLSELHPDVAVITTPHPFHVPLALDSFAAGCHVLTEKPMAVEVKEADRMIAAANAAGRILAVNFQQRFRPVVEHAYNLIQQGAIGPLVRVLCVEPWYRPAAYFRAATWRGTWKGEGGGVLLNQAPHTLDLLCYLAGMPVKVWGWTRTLYHTIETEDTAQAMFEYANGAPGYFETSTVEAGSKQHLYIVGEYGALDISDTTLTITRFSPSLAEYRRTGTDLYGKPGSVVETLELAGDGGGHLAVYRDLQDAILQNRAPRADGREALMSLELANAITYSSYTEQPVRLPLNRNAYASLLDELKRGNLPIPPNSVPLT